ncbi:MAG: membrane protein insertion efficiency factor YidD [Myxococcota bacterium]
MLTLWAEAIREHGASQGFYLTLRRILRCHPWHRGDMIQYFLHRRRLHGELID